MDKIDAFCWWSSADQYYVCNFYTVNDKNVSFFFCKEFIYWPKIANAKVKNLKEQILIEIPIKA